MYTCAFGVCKLPIHLKGARCNLIERDRWRDRWRLKLAEWLCPVIACADDGSWIVMQRAHTDTSTRRAPEHPAHVKALDDTGANNWGWIDSRPVLVDYGYPE